MSRVHALLAVIGRNLRIARRRPDLTVQTVAVPMVVLGLASIIFGATDAWPTALTDGDDTAASRQVVRALEDTHGSRGPYYALSRTSEGAASELVRSGRGQLSVHMPPGFAEDQTLRVTTYNINTDAMKNVRLRLDVTANLYDDRAGHQQLHATITKARPVDVSRTAFMGGSAIILALLLGSTLIAANLFAMEQEIRTTKELVLTPLGAGIGAAGAAAAAIVLAVLTAVPTGLMALAFGFRAGAGELLCFAAILIPAMIAGGGLGVLLAQLLRTHRAIQPTVILASLGTYFAAGGFIPVPGLPPAARGFSAWWPPSYVFEWANLQVHSFATHLRLSHLAVLLAAACVGAALAGLAGAREARRQGHGGQ
jgi:ABC-type multidrug transport system permease subunit